MISKSFPLSVVSPYTFVLLLLEFLLQSEHKRCKNLKKISSSFTTTSGSSGAWNCVRDPVLSTLAIDRDSLTRLCLPTQLPPRTTIATIPPGAPGPLLLLCEGAPPEDDVLLDVLDFLRVACCCCCTTVACAALVVGVRGVVTASMASVHSCDPSL